MKTFIQHESDLFVQAESLIYKLVFIYQFAAFFVNRMYGNCTYPCNDLLPISRHQHFVPDFVEFKEKVYFYLPKHQRWKTYTWHGKRSGC